MLCFGSLDSAFLQIGSGLFRPLQRSHNRGHGKVTTHH